MIITWLTLLIARFNKPIYQFDVSYKKVQQLIDDKIFLILVGVEKIERNNR